MHWKQRKKNFFLTFWLKSWFWFVIVAGRLNWTWIDFILKLKKKFLKTRLELIDKKLWRHLKKVVTLWRCDVTWKKLCRYGLWHHLKKVVTLWHHLKKVVMLWHHLKKVVTLWHHLKKVVTLWRHLNFHIKLVQYITLSRSGRLNHIATSTMEQLKK